MFKRNISLKSCINILGQPDPLGPYTPEADQALVDSEEARARSAYLRRELKEAIDRTEKLQKAAHKSVNDGLTQKVAETITLKVRLLLQVVDIKINLAGYSRGHFFFFTKISHIFKGFKSFNVYLSSVIFFYFFFF